MELQQSVSDMITRCPKCQTSFRITQSQLQTAKGSVRCGSCLHIFKAMDNLVHNKDTKDKQNKDSYTDDSARRPRKPIGIRSDTTKAKTQANEAPTPNLKFDLNKAPAVAPQAKKPTFEYHKPKPLDVSTKDIEQALRSSVDPDTVNTPSSLPKMDVDVSELEKDVFGDLEADSFDEMDLSLNDELELEEDLETDVGTRKGASLPRFTLADQPSSKTTQDDDLEFGIPDDILDEDDSTQLAEGDDQQNMLRFDQAAIDRNTGSYPAVTEDDFLISDDMATGDDEPIASKAAYGEDLEESFLDMDTWSPKETSLFDRKSKPPKDEEDSDDRHAPDESWAIDLLEDDDDDGPNFSGVHNSLNDLDLEMEDPDYEPRHQEYSRATTGSFNAIEDSDIEEALGEPLGEHIEPKLDSKKSLSEEELYPEFDYPQDDYNSEQDSYTDSYDDEDYGGDYYSQEDRSALIKGIRPAPLEFAHYHGKRDWRKTLIWGGSVVAGTLVLILQVAWLQFDTLSRQQPYRSFYSFFCPVFACDVPPMAAPNMIRASNLVVRSHPNADNALMVDTILLNTAPFNQPFPDVVLNFSSADGKSLAARRFKPNEYLGGELAGRSQMPIGQPVHLTLEIVDPGPEAVSYSAYIPN